MAKKYTISLTDIEAESFSLELYKSQLLQNLLREHYKTHQPNELLAKRMIEMGYISKDDPVRSAANMASATSVIKTKQDAEARIKKIGTKTASQKLPITYHKTSNWGA